MTTEQVLYVMEAGHTEDVVIRNNVFTRSKDKAIFVEPTKPQNGDTDHKNLTIKDNTFYLKKGGQREVLVDAKYVENLNIRNNKIYRQDPNVELNISADKATGIYVPTDKNTIQVEAQDPRATVKVFRGTEVLAENTGSVNEEITAYDNAKQFTVEIIADEEGTFHTNWLALDGIWFYFDGEGYMQTGWQWIDGNCYCFYGSGAMAAM